MISYPRTGRYVNGLAETLLRGPSSLTRAEREVIAAYVSAGNRCAFCTLLHAAVARHLLGEERDRLSAVLVGMEPVPAERLDPSDKLHVLLRIAEAVRRDGHLVSEQDVARARAAGADDQAIHDTILIAAMFCMINRYVDGLGVDTPADAAVYDRVGRQLAAEGYTRRVGWDARTEVGVEPPTGDAKGPRDGTA